MDRNELIQFYRANVEKIYKFFFYKTFSKEVSEDLTSDTFIAFVDAAGRDSYIEDYSKFLYGIAKNIFIQYLKRKYKDRDLFADFYEVDFESYVVEVESWGNQKSARYEKVIKYLARVPARQREVLRLRLIEKLSLKEICKQLKKSMNYVKTTQKRGIKSLKELIETEV